MDAGSVTGHPGKWITLPGGDNFSIHPMGPWAEFIEMAPANTSINLGDPLTRCKLCNRLYRPNLDKHSHE